MLTLWCTFCSCWLWIINRNTLCSVWKCIFTETNSLESQLKIICAQQTENEIKFGSVVSRQKQQQLTLLEIVLCPDFKPDWTLGEILFALINCFICEFINWPNQMTPLIFCLCFCQGSFAEVRVYSLGLFAVISCLKRENYTVPTKGLSLKLPMDPRICLNYLPGSFMAPVMAQTMV